MMDAVIADLLAIAHFAFIAFVVAGGFALRGVLTELLNWICPLTPLEVSFRHAAGQAGYSGDFIEPYLVRRSRNAKQQAIR